MPSLPPKQAHIVQLKVEQPKRELPKPPVEEQLKENKKPGLRLTNFFRSVKFPRSKKVQNNNNSTPTKIYKVFGKDLNDLAKTTGLEGMVFNGFNCFNGFIGFCHFTLQFLKCLLNVPNLLKVMA